MRLLTLSLGFALASSASAQTGKTLLRWSTAAPAAYESSVTATTELRGGDEDGFFRSHTPDSSRYSQSFILRPTAGGELDVEVYRGAVTHSDSSAGGFDKLLRGVQAMIDSLEGTIDRRRVPDLRAAITPDGNVTSFWLPSGSESLVALHLDLPDDSVAVGDTWRVRGVDLVTMRGQFRASEASRENDARLVALEERDGRTVAVIEYALRDEVVGQFESPGQNSGVRFIYEAEARGEFDVASGGWIRLEGRRRTESNFPTEQIGTETFVLLPLDTIPTFE